MNPKIILAAASLLLCLSVQAQDRDSRSALIIGISTYAARSVPDLPGVQFDMASAAAIARAMGIPESRRTVLRDSLATKEAILRELDKLGESVGEGGRVLIYFSGHGTRWYEASLGGCKEGLLAHDGQALTNEEIARYTRRIGERADKVIVMIDACHSEGVNSVHGALRGGRAGYFVPKFFVKDDATAEACAKPSNLKTRSLLAENTRLGALRENFVHVTSSRVDEASFDEPGKGGLATQGVRDCLLGEAQDLDESGAVSMAEIERCAQRFVDEKLKPHRGLLPHHVTVGGNRNLVPVAVVRPAVAASTATAAPAPLPPLAVAPVAPVRPAPVAGTLTAPMPPVPAATAVAPAASLSTLREIAAQADPRRNVDVTSSAPSLRIGKDSLDLKVRSSHEGYLYLVLLGSDARSFYVLFPNGLDSDNRIGANQTLSLPRPDWRLVAKGPPGTDHLLALVSETPRNLATLSLSPPDAAAPFTFALSDLAGRSALVDLFAGRGVTGWSERFGARLLSIREVP